MPLFTHECFKEARVKGTSTCGTAGSRKVSLACSSARVACWLCKSSLPQRTLDPSVQAVHNYTSVKMK